MRRLREIDLAPIVRHAVAVRETRRAEVQAIGADAVNQAIKAVAVARGYLEQDSINVICIPTFVDVEIEGEERTAIKLIIEPRDPSAPFAPIFRSKARLATQG